MMAWVVLAAAGALAFVWGLAAGDPARVWAIYLVNLVFWAGLAVTGPAIAAMMQLTEARWSPAVRRLALTTAGFLPVALVLFVGLFFGRTALYPWETTPVPLKAAWLNTPFFWLRTLVGAAALFGAALAFVGVLRREPAGALEARERARRNRLAVVLLFLWVIVLSLWGYDLLMSLAPQWYSGLFGGYFVVTTLYTGFALLSILTIRADARRLPVIPPAAVQDVAKLQFAFSIVWMYFFWSQYLVIWYGNVPVETRFLLQRFFVQPWQTVAWVVMIVGWLIPFCYLVVRLTGRPPSTHAGLLVTAVFALVAIFLERILVVFPSISAAAALPTGLGDLAITAGFLALFMLSRRWFLERFKLTA